MQIDSASGLTQQYINGLQKKRHESPSKCFEEAITEQSSKKPTQSNVGRDNFSSKYHEEKANKEWTSK